MSTHELPTRKIGDTKVAESIGHGTMNFTGAYTKTDAIPEE